MSISINQNVVLQSRLHFSDLINRYNFHSAVEIGVFKGKFSIHLLKYCPQLSLTLIDAWDGTGMSNPYDPESVFSEIMDVQDKYGVERVSIIREQSLSAVMTPQIKKQQFDFIYIDADHRFESVVNDIYAWWPKVKVGGVLAGHDYNNRGSKRVRSAVDSIFEKVNITQERCASWWIFKSEENLP